MSWVDQNGNVYITSGKVGIGTDSPSYILQVKDNNGISISRSNYDDGLSIRSDLNSGYAYFTVRQGAPYSGYVFSSGGSERVRIEADGHVGIGTASPSEQLHATGNVRADGKALVGDGSASAPSVGFINDP